VTSMGGAAPDAIVVGAGIVGACCAYELAGDGAAVTVLERGGGWGEGCSWGNAGLLVPSHARPIAAPESLKAGLG
jgi:D-amino-acid dehydrogenase